MRSNQASSAAIILTSSHLGLPLSTTHVATGSILGTGLGILVPAAVVALVLLNRSPAALDYWMEQILKVADPSAYGTLRAELVKIVTEQRGSDLSQAFVITGLTVDAETLTSVVDGDLKTFVGGQVIASEKKRFRFGWRYAGLRLSLLSFVLVPDKKDASL